jgi:hypothetical protein
MKRTQKVLGISLLLMVLFPSCTNDLNQAPNSTNAISGDGFFYRCCFIYKQNLAKLYAGFATSGQSNLRDL